MEIVLLQPDFGSQTGPLVFEPPPYALIELSSYLMKLNIENEVFDGSFYTVSKFERYLKKAAPMMVGVHLSANSSHDLLQFLGDNSRDKSYQLVGFGPYCKGKEESLLYLGFDFIISEEVEDTFLELYSTLKVPMNPFFDHIEGLSYLNANGEMTQTPRREIQKTADDYPWNRLRTIELERYDTRFFPYSVKHINYELISEHCRKSTTDVTQELNHLKDTVEGVYLYDLDLSSEYAIELFKTFKALDLTLDVMVKVLDKKQLDCAIKHGIKNVCIDWNIPRISKKDVLADMENVYFLVKGEFDFTQLKFYIRKYGVNNVFTEDVNYSLQLKIKRAMKRNVKESFFDRLFKAIGL